MNFDPKANFKKFRPAHAEKLRAEVEQPYFQESLTFALAEMSSRDATTEQIQGANVFVSILCGLAEKEVEPVKFPSRRLNTFDDQPKPSEVKKP